jgi:hypothetical protein
VAVEYAVHCGEEIPTSTFRVDVVEKMLTMKKNGGWVKKVFHFCLDAMCFAKQQTASNHKLPILKPNSLIFLDLTVHLSVAECKFLSSLNLIELNIL